MSVDGDLVGPLIARRARALLVPAAVFQSVLIGGGYGTGREAVEYLTQSGPGAGLLAVGVYFLTITAVLAASFEFARMFRTYDYRHFFKALLGKAWWLFEVLAVLLMTLVLAVVISAASTMIEDWLGVPPVITAAGVILITIIVIFLGRAVVENVLSIWAVFFSAFVILLAVLALFSSQTSDLAFADQWGLGAGKGLQYALYNIAAIPILLYTVSALENRREAITAAVLAGVAGAFPALLMHLMFLPHAPAILDEALPMLTAIEALEFAPLMPIYVLLLVGTIVHTAIGVLEGVIQRIDGWRFDTGRAPLESIHRGVLVGAVLIASSAAAGFGVIALIASGYGTLAWGFMVVYAFPVLTIGVWRILKAPQGSPTPDPTEA